MVSTLCEKVEIWLFRGIFGFVFFFSRTESYIFLSHIEWNWLRWAPKKTGVVSKAHEIGFPVPHENHTMFASSKFRATSRKLVAINGHMGGIVSYTVITMWADQWINSIYLSVQYTKKPIPEIIEVKQAHALLITAKLAINLVAYSISTIIDGTL